MNDFSRLISEFFGKYAPIQRGLSENTIRTYRDAFVGLLEYIKVNKGVEPDAIELEDLHCTTVSSFLDWLEEEKKISTSTRNNRLAAIKSFFKFVSFTEPRYLAQCSLIAGIKQKKCETKPMNYLSISAIQSLLLAPDKSDKKQLRALCLIALLYESGARVSELTTIKTYEIRLSPPYTLILHGKGNKTRVVPVDASVTTLVAGYVGVYEIKPDEPLFFNARREALTREGVNHILQSYFKKAKEKNPDLFPGSISPHSLRHSRSMHLLENNVNLIYIRDLLGHASVSTTEIYSKANPEIKRKHIEMATERIVGGHEDYTPQEKHDLLSWLRCNI